VIANVTCPLSIATRLPRSPVMSGNRHII
jgi:hypothetical protein